MIEAQETLFLSDSSSSLLHSGGIYNRLVDSSGISVKYSSQYLSHVIIPKMFRPDNTHSSTA